MRRRVVLTGFGPFEGFPQNPSADVAKRVEELGDERFELVEVRIVPVTYDDVEKNVADLWQRHNPDLIVHLGAHGVAGTVRLEQQSFQQGYCRFDIKGTVPLSNCCPVDGPAIRRSKIDCTAVSEAVRQKLGAEVDKIRIDTSLDPGHYLCGYSFYLSLSRDERRALFIHVPPLTNPDDLETVAKIVNETLAEICARLPTND